MKKKERGGLSEGKMFDDFTGVELLANNSEERTPTGRLSKKKTLNQRELKRLRKILPPLPKEVTEWIEAVRPRFRHQCQNGPRPCPYVSCKYHLYLDVNPETGSIKLNFPGKEVWELEETCALDVAERGGKTLEEVGFLYNLTRERVRQIELAGLKKIKGVLDELGLSVELFDELLDDSMVSEKFSDERGGNDEN